MNGFIAFAVWSAISTYLYVCKMQGLCDEPIAMQVAPVKSNDIIAKDAKNVEKEQVESPKDLVIHFAFDKSEFSSNAGSDKYYDESNSYLEQNAKAIINITGYTDFIGTNEYNQKLGYRRAQRIQLYFESKGIRANKIIISSKGEENPIDNNNTKAGRANNRRAIITLKK